MPSGPFPSNQPCPLCVSPETLNDMLAEAAKRGAHVAVTELLGLTPEQAENLPDDMRSLRELLQSWKGFKRGVSIQIGRFITWLLLGMLVFLAANHVFPTFSLPWQK